MNRITLGQLNDVMFAAQMLGPIEIGNAEAFRKKVQEMPTPALYDLIQAVVVVRRVAREWHSVGLEMKIDAEGGM